MKRYFIFLKTILAAFFAFAACNPEPEDPECDQISVEKSCDKVEGPSAGGIEAEANCTNFVFKLYGVTDGKEYINLTETYSGGENCMEPKTLPPEENELKANVAWNASKSSAEVSGSGNVVEIPRAKGECRASCTFTVSVSPTVCDAPAPILLTAQAVFEDKVEMTERVLPRLCCISTNHPPHIFDIKSCDQAIVALLPNEVASVVLQTPTNAVVLGMSAYENVQAKAKAPCGETTENFDVVSIGSLSVKGLCGCFEVSDATESDEDAPIAETMFFGPYNTGLEFSLPVTPNKWAVDAKWKIDGEGWMLKEGNFTNGKNNIYASSVGACSIDAWFDCNPDKVRAGDEPKRRVIGTVARLGELEVLGDSEKNHGKTNACDETFSPGTKVLFANTGFMPENRAHKLKVIKTLAADKNHPMTIPVGEIPSAGFNKWQLKIQDDCPDGLFWVELTDPLHSCTSVVKRFCVQQCVCATCDEFAKDVLANGCIDISFGLGRTASGGAKAPVRVILESTEKLPELSSEVAADGRMDVLTTNGAMIVSFTRKDEEIPVAVFTLTPGADVFTLSEIRDGSLRKTARWMLNQGVWTMEVWDETASPAMLVKRDVRISTITQSGKMERLTSGEQVTETEYAAISEIGLLPIRETRGAGSEARSTYTSYITSGNAKGRIHSEVSSDGSWTLYEYDSSNRVKSVIVPFGDASPILDDKKAVVGYNGRVRKTEYSYEPVDSRDDASTLADEARAIIEKIGSDAFGWIEVSRNYSAHFVEGNIRTEISEKASSPLASYGTEENQRTVSKYLINCQGAGRPIRRETSDGLLTLWEYEFTPSNVVIETMTAPLLATNGVPFKTTIERTIEDLRGDVLREEMYVLTDAGRELLSWVEYARDGAGHEIKRITSDGKIVERAWSCCGPEWEKDERGIITDYSYDALGRQVTTTRNGITTFRMYDLLGNVTNETRFAGLLFVSSSTGYDSAGRRVWSVGEDGARTEYVYSTSSEGGKVRTTIQAAGTDCAVTNTIISLRDGSTKAMYLNGVLKTTEVHEPFASLIYEGTNGLASARWSRSESDFLGRTVAQSRPGFGGSTLVTSNYYDTAGNLVSTISLSTRSTRSTRLNSQLYFYNELNERIATIDDLNFNETIDWTGPDLISSNLTHYVKLNGDWWRETRQWSIHDNDSAVPRLMGVHRSRVTGLGVDNLASESVTINQRGNETLSRTIRNRDAAEEIAWTKNPTSTTPAVTVSTNGLIYSSTSQTGVITIFGYDALQRQIAQIDGRGNTTRTIYDNLGRVASTIDALGYATTYGYDALGRQVSVTDPLTNTVTTAYDAEGHIISQRGATYPVDYSYNEFGEKISMTTYRTRGTGNGELGTSVQGDVTRWLRDEATGLVTNKVYADGKGPKYNYTLDDKLATRTWARGEVRNVIYDNYNRVIGVLYPFSSTGNVDYQRDRVGASMRCIVSNLCDIVHVRDEYHYITNEMIHVDERFYDIKRNYDLYGRNVGFSICETNGCITSVKKRIYDELGRTGGYVLVNAVGKSIKVNCIYDAESKIASLRYVFQNDALLEKRFERELLRSGFVTNRVCLYNSQIIHRISTIYDVLGRPIKATDLSSTAREWLYNNRNELASAVIGTNSYAYAYDSIGNREWAALNSATNSYTVNSLNQYSQLDASQFAYDADGNLTQDGRYNYTYDAENRLVSIVPIAPTEGSLSIDNRYDHKGLRIGKTVKRFENGYWKSHATHTFIFDGGNIVLERIAKADGNQVIKEYFWGMDKSGTEQGAGGVGGLLAVSVNGVFSIPCYDHNGNIVAYVSETGGIESLFVYDAYGNTIEKSGEKADVHSFGFSTKYHDREVDLIGYQKRFYSPDHGRWLNRDPIEEEGGENLYAFCLNSPQCHMDINGLSTCCRNGRKISCDTTYKWEGSVTTASVTWLLGATFVMVDLVSNFICSSCTRYRLHAKAVLPTISYGAPISITGSNVKFGNYPPESFVGSVSLISAGFGAMSVVEAARLSIGNATSSSFGLVGGAEIGISAGYGWFVDFELTEE